jgi:lamin tail-like protein
MKIGRSVGFALGIGALAGYMSTASAAIVITEVDPYGSNSSDGYAADWFELTNTGSTAVSIAGWSMVDNHAASNTSSPYAAGATISIGNLSGSNATFGAALLTLANGQTTLAAGQTAVFLESTGAATTTASATIISNFESTWFGSQVPSTLTVGTYDDGSSGAYGLSQTTDMVNIFSGSSASSALVASVAFGADGGTPVSTFDNTAGLNNTTLTTKSVAGVNGAFVSATGGLEVGSPGIDAAPVPLPASFWLLVSGFGGLSAMVRKRKSA